MILTEKKIRIIRTALISSAIICLTPICERGRLLNGAKGSSDMLAGKDIVCAIDLGDDMLGSHGLETGFNYELVRRYAEDNGCSVQIIAADSRSGAEYIDSLRSGEADIVITHIDNAEIPEDVHVSRTVNDCSVWMTASKDQTILEINKWLRYYSSTEDYAKLRKRFFTATNPIKRAAKGIIAENISPYDNLIKEHASTLGWDWRMLAAVIYQESKFSINSRSHRGATGLMQVMPHNGSRYGVEDLTNPENNLLVGTSHLSRLQNMFKDKDFSHEELIKFTLAAYNAGEGRISDCRSLASAQGLDNTKWENIVKVIPLMRDDSILEDESVKHGKFQGHETIAYVENVMEIYKAICSICPEA